MTGFQTCALPISQFDHLAARVGQHRKQSGHPFKLLPRLQIAIGQGVIINDVRPFDLGHRSEIDYSGASHLVRDDRTCGLMEIASRILDMIDGGEVGDAAISILDHIIDVDDMAPTSEEHKYELQSLMRNS